MANLCCDNTTLLCLCRYVNASFIRYDFGITAWSVLMIRQKGASGLSGIYTYLAARGEALGFIVACAPFGGFVEGIIGSKASLCVLGAMCY